MCLAEVCCSVCPRIYTNPVVTLEGTQVYTPNLQNGGENVTNHKKNINTTLIQSCSQIISIGD